MASPRQHRLGRTSLSGLLFSSVYFPCAVVTSETAVTTEKGDFGYMVSSSVPRRGPGIPGTEGLSRESRPVLRTQSLERIGPRVCTPATSAVPSPPWPAEPAQVIGCQEEATPEHRLSEIAAILAVAVLRLRKARKAPARNLPESGRNPLEVCPKSRLSVTTG
jgi:hypothetical protein